MPGAMTALEVIGHKNHPGTTIGCLDIISTDFEELVNNLIDETIREGACSDLGSPVDTKHRANDMQTKLYYLQGFPVQLMAESGQEEDFEIQRKISRNVYKLLDSIRKRRNDHLHNQQLVYDVVNKFDDLIVQCKSNRRFLFRHSEAPKILPQQSVQVDDLEPGNQAKNDMVVSLYTRKEYRATMQTVPPLPETVTHFLVIHYGNEEYTYGIRPALVKSWKEALFGVTKAHPHSAYFQFRTEQLMKRLAPSKGRKRRVQGVLSET